jgi:hypothetical protein
MGLFSAIIAGLDDRSDNGSPGFWVGRRSHIPAFGWIALLRLNPTDLGHS